MEGITCFVSRLFTLRSCLLSLIVLIDGNKELIFPPSFIARLCYSSFSSGCRLCVSDSSDFCGESIPDNRDNQRDRRVSRVFANDENGMKMTQDGREINNKDEHEIDREGTHRTPRLIKHAFNLADREILVASLRLFPFRSSLITIECARMYRRTLRTGGTGWKGRRGTARGAMEGENFANGRIIKDDSDHVSGIVHTITF